MPHLIELLNWVIQKENNYYTMKLKLFTFNPFQENTYLIHDDNGNCLIFDPGNSNPDEDALLFDFIEANSLKPLAIYNTHCHIDHVYGIVSLIEKYDIPLYIPQKEESVLKSAPMVANMYAMQPPSIPEEYNFIKRHKEIEHGNIKLRILSVPGHSPDHLVFYSESQDFLIAGDTLFRESIGRTDLPGGNHDLLLSKIQSEIFSLPNDTDVYPGHGLQTTVGYEKEHNMFLK